MKHRLLFLAVVLSFLVPTMGAQRGSTTRVRTSAIRSDRVRTPGSITSPPHLLVLLPGESVDATSFTGKSGTATAVTSGSAVTVTVWAADVTFHVLHNITDTVAITSSDANATLPSNAALVGGTKTFSITLKAAGSGVSVSASDVTMGGSGSSLVTVNAGAFSKLQLLVPSETAAPGTATGKVSVLDDQATGTAFNVTVNAVDANWNLVNTVTDTVGITTSGTATLPANAALVSGTKSFAVTFTAAGSPTLTATDITNGAKTANTSPAITVVSGTSVWTRIAHLEQGGTAGNGFTSSTFDSTGADLIAVGVARVDGLTVSNISDNKSNCGGAFTQQTQYAGSTLNRFSWWVCEAPATVGSGHTITVTGNAYGSISVEVWSGSKGAGATDQVVGSTVVLGTSLSQALSPSTTNQLVLTAAVHRTTFATFTVDSGFSSGVGVDFDAPNRIGITSSYHSIVDESITPGWTWSGAQSIAMSSISFKPASGGSGGIFTKLQILMPGETASPGAGSGKTGSPSARTAGSAFNVTVNAVDDNWNVIATTTDVVALTSTDAYATLPANAALVAGTKTFSITPKTAGSKTFTVSDITRPTKTANTSPSTTVNAGAFSKLQLILPTETALPGSSTGKASTVSAEGTGVAFTAIVNAVDANWNVVSSTDTVGITGGGAGATLPSNHALSAGTYTFTNGVTMATLGPQTLTASDITDSGKTAHAVNITCGTKSILSQNDFEYVGVLRTPTSVTGSRGAFTAYRAGNGDIHFFMPGHIYDPILEEWIGGTPSATLTAGTPRPTVLHDYGSDGAGNAWGSARVSYHAYPDCTLRVESNAAMQISGLVLEGSNLYWTFYEGYNVAGLADWSMSMTTLDLTAHSVTAVYGPWRMTSNSHMLGGWVTRIPDAWAAAHTSNGTFGLGSPLSSGNGGSSWGPNFEAIVPPTSSTPSGCGDPAVKPPITSTAIGLRYTPYTTSTTRYRRDGNYSITALNTTDFTPTGSGANDGFWTQVDFARQAIWIDLPDKEGYLVTASMSAGVVTYENPTDPYPQYPSAGYPPCGHTTGPNASAYERRWFVFDPAQLAANITSGIWNATIAASTIDPQAIHTLTPIIAQQGDGGPEPPSGVYYDMMCSHHEDGLWFDPVSRYLYVAMQQADFYGEPYTVSPLIQVYHIK